MKKILFQGDSITDCGRNYQHDPHMGSGYATMVTGRLGYMYPNEYSFTNRGIGGNRIVDVYARIKSDIINLAPDYMSLLIGVNDVWHELERQNGVDTEKFEKIYSMLISEIKEALPDIKIIILEPFVLEGSATADKIDEFRKGVSEKAAVSKSIAEKFGLNFIPLQKYFDEQIKNTPSSYWSEDGVHPNPTGHGLIAEKWIEEFEKIK